MDFLNTQGGNGLLVQWNKIIVSFFVCVCVGGGGNNRNKKWDMLSGALFATLSQRQNTPHTFYFSVPSRKITH